MSETEHIERTIVYALGPDVGSDMAAVQKYADGLKLPLVVIGDGKRDIKLDEITSAIADAKGKLTLMIDMHGSMSSDRRTHQIRLKGDIDQADSQLDTAKLFDAVGGASGQNPIECIFMPCQTTMYRDDAFRIKSGAEGVELNATRLPKGSSVCFLSSVGDGTIVEDIDDMFLSIVQNKFVVPPTADALFSAYLAEGLQRVQTQPTLFEASGDIQNPAMALAARLKKEPGQRFNLDDIEAIGILNRPDLAVAMEKINQAPFIGGLYSRDQYSWGDALYVEHVLSKGGGREGNRFTVC